MTSRSKSALVIAAVVWGIASLAGARSATAQSCGASVTAPQCDGQCPFGQMCADTGSGCGCTSATFACGNPSNPNGPPVCWGACPSPTMLCATFAGGCTCIQGALLCGNGAPDPGEACDDGNTVDGDGCDSNCTPTGCGNGLASSGEQCDGTDVGSCLTGCAPDCTCANGPPTPSQVRCFAAIAKSATKFVAGRLKLLQTCRERELKAPSSCPSPDPLALQALDDKLLAALSKQCGVDAPNFDAMGFPGRCTDPNPLDGFTTTDLALCIRHSHAAIVDDLMTVEVDPALVGPISDPEQAKCQSVLAHAGSQMLLSTLKAVQLCRTAILKGVLPPGACDTDLKTTVRISKAAIKSADAIVASCSNAAVVALAACTPNQITTGAAAACIVAKHRNAADDPIVADPADLIDYEYATQPVCGDHEVNQPVEECDGPSAVLCPGLCQADCTCP